MNRGSPACWFMERAAQSTTGWPAVLSTTEGAAVT